MASTKSSSYALAVSILPAFRKTLRLILAASALIGLSERSAHATSYTWSTGTAWNTAADWTPAGGPPGAGDSATFNSASYNPITVATANTQVGEVILGASSKGTLTIADTDTNGLTINGLTDSNNGGAFTGMLLNSGSTTAVTFAGLTNISASQTWTNNSSGLLTIIGAGNSTTATALSNTSTGTSPVILTINGSGAVTIAGAIADGATAQTGLTVGTTGTGVVSLTTISSTFTGPISIIGGTLNVSYFGSENSTGGIVDTTGTDTASSMTITVASTTGLVVGEYVNGTNITAGTYITAINTSTDAITLNEATGSTAFTNEALAFGESSLGAVGSAASNILINGGTLEDSSLAGVLTNRLFELGSNGGTLSASASTATVEDAMHFTNTGAITFQTPNVAETFTLAGTAGPTNHLSTLNNYYNYFLPQLTDNGTGQTQLVKTGDGTWVLGSTTSTFTGGINVEAGQLQLVSPNSAGDSIINSSNNSALLSDGASGVTSANGLYGNISVAAGAVLSVNAFGTASTSTNPNYQVNEFQSNDLDGFFEAIENDSNVVAGATVGIDPSDGAVIGGTEYTYDSNITLNNGVNLARYNLTGLSTIVGESGATGPNLSPEANLLLGGNITLNGGGGFGINLGGANVIPGFNAPVQSTYAFTELTGNNTYTGPTILNGGGLVLGSLTALGNASGPGTSELLLENSSTLAADNYYIQGSATTPYVISAPIVASPPAALSTGTIALVLGEFYYDGDLNGSGVDSGIQNLPLDFTGTLTGTSFIGSNPVTGVGTIAFEALGTAVVPVTLGGNIYISNANSGVETLEFYDNGPNSTTTPLFDVTGNIYDSTVAGAATGTGDLLFTGYNPKGIYVLSGANAYSGTTTIDGGIVEITTFNSVATNSTLGTVHSATSSLGAPTTVANGTITFAGGASTYAYIVDTGTGETTDRVINLQGSGEYPQTYDPTMSIENDGTGPLVFTSNFENTTTGAAMLGLTGSSASTNVNAIDGVLTDSTAAGDAKLGVSVNYELANRTTAVYGTSTWSLGGANTYSGLTAIQGGVLEVSNLALGGVATTATGTTSSSTITVGSTTGLAVGQSVAGAGITPGTTIVSISGSNVTLSSDPNASLSSTTLDFGTANNLGISTNAASNLLLINGGTLEYTGAGGASGTTDRLFTLYDTGTTDDSINASGTGSLDLSNPGAIAFYAASGSNIIAAPFTLTLTGTNTGSNIFAPQLVNDIVSTGTGATAGADPLTLTKTGAGTWVLTNGNTYSGVTTVSGGILSVTSLANGGATTTSSNESSTSNTITVASATGLVVGQTVTGPNIAAGTTITAISGTTVTLSADPTATATTATTLYFGTPNGLGFSTNAAANLVINGGALQYSGSTAASTDRLFDSGVGANGAILDASGVGAGSTLTFSNTGSESFLTANTATTLTLTGTNTGVNTLAALLKDNGTGALTLLKNGVGTWTLTGANTFTGGATIDGGTLDIAAFGAVGAAQALGESNTVTFSGTSAATQGTLAYTGSTAASLNQNVTVTSGDYGTIFNNGGGLLTLTGTLTKMDSVLTLSGGTYGIDVMGSITGGTTSTFDSDVDITDGTTTYGMAESYTGPTDIYDNGTLKDGVTNAVPVGSIINIGASSDSSVVGTVTNTFDLNGYNQTIAALNSTSTANNDNVVTNSGASGSNTLTLSGSDSDGNTANGAYGGVIQDGGTATTALAVSGGTQILTGVNTYSAGTTITGGTLYVNGGVAGTSSGSGSGAISVSSGATLGGSGVIRPGSGNGITMLGTSTLISGGIQAAASPTTTAGVGLTLDNSVAQSTILNASTGTANLTFYLGAGSNGLTGSTTGQAQFVFSNPNTDSTYMTVIGSTAGELAFATNDTITVNDLTNNNLQLSLDTPYLLIQASNNADYTGLITSGDINGMVNQNGWVTNLDLTGSAASEVYAGRLYLYDGDLEVVPEPSTWAMILGGLAVLVYWQRRKSKLS